MPSTRSRTHRVGLISGLLGVLWGAPSFTGAQETCEFVAPGNDVLFTRAPFTYVSNPHMTCEGGVEIWADSAVVNRDQSMSLLLGSVRYADESRELRSVEARYFYEVQRLQARGEVQVVNFEDSSGVRNGDLVYLRQTDTREVEEMTFTTGSDGLRPRATVYPKRAEPSEEPAQDGEPGDSVAIEPDEYIVLGDRLFFRGDSYFAATGTVEIERDSLFAFADSAEYSGDEGLLVLDGSARVEGSSYDLSGRTITLASATDGTDEIHALHEAVLTGEDLRVTAPRIILRLVDGEIDRMVAVPLPDDADADSASAAEPPQRPLAISEEIELVGDSLDLAAPEGVIERIFAAGTARSVSSGRPELNIEALPDIARTDWIEADSIEVMLVPATVDPDSAVADTAATPGASDDYEVDRIIAKVRARSLYRLVPSDSTAVVGVDPPAVSYMVADQITIIMVDGQADRVESVGQVSGWHLEPLKGPPPDSVSSPAAPDSVLVPTPASTVPPQGNGGDGRPLGAYLSPASPTPQRWRVQ